MSLEVEDDHGALGRASRTLVIAEAMPDNQPPVARAGADLEIEVATDVTFDATASTDPDGAIVA